MVLHRPEYLLQPVNQGFIAFSLFAALLLDILPWGRLPAVPDFLALTILFWNIHQPRRVGIGIAFLFGLVMDVHEARLLGEHALAYTLISYGAIELSRRVLSFGPLTQTLHVLPLLLLSQAVVMIVRLVVGGEFPDWPYFLQSVTGALMWPLVTSLLLAPQRAAVDKDANRPL